MNTLWPEEWADLLHRELIAAGMARGAAWEATAGALSRDCELCEGRVDAVVRGRKVRMPAFVLEQLRGMNVPSGEVLEQMSLQLPQG